MNFLSPNCFIQPEIHCILIMNTSLWFYCFSEFIFPPQSDFGRKKSKCLLSCLCGIWSHEFYMLHGNTDFWIWERTQKKSMVVDYNSINNWQIKYSGKMYIINNINLIVITQIPFPKNRIFNSQTILPNPLCQEGKKNVLQISEPCPSSLPCPTWNFCILFSKDSMPRFCYGLVFP